MADRPRAPTHSRVGSNLKAHKQLAAARAALFAKRLTPLDRAERQFHRQQREILTKPVLRNATEILGHQRDAYDEAFMKANGSGIKVDDMNGFISAVSLWEVKRLSIGVR